MLRKALILNMTRRYQGSTCSVFLKTGVTSPKNEYPHISFETGSQYRRFGRNMMSKKSSIQIRLWGQYAPHSPNNAYTLNGEFIFLFSYS